MVTDLQRYCKDIKQENLLIGWLFDVGSKQLSTENSLLPTPVSRFFCLNVLKCNHIKMYAIKINKEKVGDLNKSDEPKIYIGHGILSLFGVESATICAVCLSYGTEGISDSIRFKGLSKSKIRSGIERLLCCGILIIKDGKLVFDKDRFVEINHLGCKVDDEKHKNYIGMGTMEQVMEYEKMLKFVRKIVK